jgi:Arc/MetJ-type ribon-helix-helix transcriptional regulator
MENQTVRWDIAVPKNLDDYVDKALKVSTYKTRVEFVRAAVRLLADKILKENQEAKSDGTS